MDQQMEIEEILLAMEERLEQAKAVPFSDKVMVDREELFDMITEIRLKMPTEIQQSKWVLEEQNRIIVEAQQEAEAKIKAGEEERLRMINEHEVTKKAYQQAEEIVENAKRVSKDMRMGAKEYADDLLMQIDDQMKQLASFTNDELGKLVGIIDTRNKEFASVIDQKSRILQQNRKELDIHRD